MITDEVKELFIKKFESAGQERFYKFLITYSLEKASSPTTKKGPSPELELINYEEKFLQLYRRENEDVYLDIAKQFRRAANKIYRILLKQNIIKYNNKFLNLVSKQ
jgi:hypothetical protein